MDIVSIVYFLIPGFFYNYLHRHIWDKKIGKFETEGYIVLSGLVVSSLIINLVYYAVASTVSGESMFFQSIEEMFSNEQGLIGVAIYLTSSFFLAFIGVLFIGTYWSRLTTWIGNFVREESGLPARNEYQAIYEEVFESEYLKKETNEYPIICFIQPDGTKRIGFLESWSASSSEEKQIIMFYSKKLKEYIFENEYPIEDFIQVEMFDCETGMHTKLYFGRDLVEKMDLIDESTFG